MNGTKDSIRARKSGATVYGWADMTTRWDQIVARMGAQSSENLDTWLSSVNALADTQKALFERTAAYSEKTLTSQWEAAQALGAAQTPAEAARFAAMAPQTIDSCMREATELFRVASEGMAAAWQPFQVRAVSLMKTPATAD